ncbi:glycosyl transferase family 90 [Tenacibaculum sp. TC6]|uniref:glycosyl transferase family 90 n=1 Tax=Tenacibaculum sp. TC6 TaxID=3423223 RepID=UPI003D35F6F3
MSFLKKVKRLKFYYYATNILEYIVPKFFSRFFLKKWLKKKPTDQILFDKRLNHYISPRVDTEKKIDWILLKKFKFPKKATLYFFDLYRITKYFDSNKRIKYKFGDVTEVFEEPTIVKSRPINHNGNSIIMKLDSLRHFNFIEDSLSFEDKDDRIVWRGEIHKENRRLLVEKFHNHDSCNIGEVSKTGYFPKHWQKLFLTPKEQLNYKFIISIEGMDVATNLKWIMNSNSLCFMPKPKYETWFMEGLLIPNHHYVLLKDDYSDLIEKRNFYLKNISEAKFIIKNANDWVNQFKDLKNEKLLSIHVLNQYFKQTSQI